MCAPPQVRKSIQATRGEYTEEERKAQKEISLKVRRGERVWAGDPKACIVCTCVWSWGRMWAVEGLGRAHLHVNCRNSAIPLPGARGYNFTS